MPHLDLQALASFAWPDVHAPTCLEGVRPRAHALHDEGEYAVFGAPWLLFPFERAAQLAGMENLPTAMVDAPDFVIALLARLTSQFKDFLGDFLSAPGDCLDVLMLGDDLGSERGLLVSRRCIAGS